MTTVRSATEHDAAAVAAVYAPYVATPISFEAEPPSAEAMAARIRATLARLPWLVAVDGADAVLGYAYAAPFRSREAYQWSVEVSVYVAPDARTRGVGRALYEALLGELRALGYLAAFAGISLPNDASVAFHERFGFEPIGVYPKVGYKLGRFWDVGWWTLRLAEHEGPGDPEPPRPYSG